MGPLASTWAIGLAGTLIAAQLLLGVVWVNPFILGALALVSYRFRSADPTPAFDNVRLEARSRAKQAAPKPGNIPDMQPNARKMAQHVPYLGPNQLRNLKKTITDYGAGKRTVLGPRAA